MRLATVQLGRVIGNIEINQTAIGSCVIGQDVVIRIKHFFSFGAEQLWASLPLAYPTGKFNKTDPRRGHRGASRQGRYRRRSSG